MKTLKIQKILHLMLWIAGLSFMTSSCIKPTLYPIPKARGLVPYHIGDTVCFVDEKGKAIPLVVTREETWWWQFDSYAYHYSENWEMVLLSATGDYQLTLSAGDQSEQMGIVNGFMCYFWSKTPPEYGIWAKVGFTSRGDFSAEHTLCDSVRIGDHVYYNVRQRNDFYYSKTHGILQMTDGKHTITLDEIKYAQAK